MVYSLPSDMIAETITRKFLVTELTLVRFFSMCPVKKIYLYKIYQYYEDQEYVNQI